jgi:hypothetical protein
MPPKTKKKRASLKLTSDGVEPVSDTVSDTGSVEVIAEPPVRQVVEVVEEDTTAEAIDTIKKDAQEIEDVAQEIEREVEHAAEASPSYSPAPAEEMETEDAPRAKAAVESLFAKDSSPVTPEITVVGKKDTSVAVWVGAMLGVVLAIGASLIFFIKGPGAFSLSFALPKPTPTPTVEPTPLPTPTAAAAVNKKDIKIQVLNGGGVAGAGSKMKTLLESKGYTVTGVANADSYTYEKTAVIAKKGSESAAAQISEDLKAEYSLDASPAGSVPASASYDVQVIVGKE